ncbi:hypothetical protein FNF29_02261 [Cafeteria roenbergensis]|uniref:PA domain-containing protein n=1 Tax=Cafeteria roenbergensis TaxID=33653 RepID=A0A5A8CNT5_CAFRO|nr:hypothetical protein FNF29_02261 [Cafeteria roenbergensis]|eukprot:KAA0154732.1 hypothetical protein FNF29_02261 [Cafeteria roenbergensis]
MRRLPGAAAAVALLAVLLAAPTLGYELPDNSAVILPDGTELHLMHASFGPAGPMLDQDPLAARAHGSPSVTQIFAPPADSPDLCVPTASPVAPAAGSARSVLALRGNCTFDSKALEASRRGFSSVIVVNTIEAITRAAVPSLNASTPVDALAVPTCDADCAAGSAWVQASALSTADALQGRACQAVPEGSRPSCAAGADACVVTGERRSAEGAGAEVRVCCLSDHSTVMQAGPGAQSPSIPAYFATVEVGRALLAAAAAAPGGRIAGAAVGLRWVPSLDGAAIVTWVIGFAALLGASWYGAEEERLRLSASRTGRPAGVPFTPAVLDAIPLTMRDAALMLLGAAVMLSVLFLLIQMQVQVVFIILFVFCLSGASAIAVLLVYPCTHRVTRLAQWERSLPCFGPTNGAAVVAGVVGAAVMLTWFLLRHEAWSWAPQDVVGALLCALFCRQIRVMSLRIAVAMCVAFLVYDVVMVFVTPAIVGSSVMIDVATAGAPAAVVDQACYCRENPNDWAVCGPGERMPILFAVPRFADYRGGFAMLGLGDVVIPGTIVTLALRLDLALGRAYTTGYWFSAVGAYGVGLGLAQLAVQLSGVGQPALLYIMPAVAIALVAVAWKRGELSRVWLFGADSDTAVAARQRRRERRQQRQSGEGDDGDASEDDRPAAAGAVAGPRPAGGAFEPLTAGSGVLGGGGGGSGDDQSESGSEGRGTLLAQEEDDDGLGGDIGSGRGDDWGVELASMSRADDQTETAGKGGARGGAV